MKQQTNKQIFTSQTNKQNKTSQTNKRHQQTSNQTNKQTNRQTNKQTNKQTHNQTNSQPQLHKLTFVCVGVCWCAGVFVHGVVRMSLWRACVRVRVCVCVCVCVFVCLFVSLFLFVFVCWCFVCHSTLLDLVLRAQTLNKLAWRVASDTHKNVTACAFLV
jgi:Flp pilus assembly protein TadB